MNRAVLLTGGNIGDVEFNIEAVLSDINIYLGVVEQTSKVYKSIAWGYESNNIFYNQAVVINTELKAEQLLEKIWEIEKKYGRDRIEVLEKRDYQDRTMDIDILFFNDDIIVSDILFIPHKEIEKRLFVLNPLCEIIGDYIHPILKISINKIRDLSF